MRLKASGPEAAALMDLVAPLGPVYLGIGHGTQAAARSAHKPRQFRRRLASVAQQQQERAQLHWLHLAVQDHLHRRFGLGFGQRTRQGGAPADGADHLGKRMGRRGAIGRTGGGLGRAKIRLLLCARAHGLRGRSI